MSEKKCPISFNSIANVLATVSAVGISGIIATGAYVYVNKDAIIDNVKQQAIEAVMGSMGGGKVEIFLLVLLILLLLIILLLYLLLLLILFKITI
tara:strand:- start:224 stop:508 length:285 start_codon:yes stop_codon:yes gene_type:complete